MILIITHKEDYTTDYVIDKLNKKAIPYFRFNCEDYLEYSIVWQYGANTLFSINGIKEFTSVWYRRTKLPVIVSDNPSEKLYLLGEIDTFLQNLFQVIKAKWLSAPQAVAIAENKLLQLQVAEQIGFQIPLTLVTTDRETLKTFAGNNKRTIIKPIARGRIDYANDTSKLIFTSLIPDQVITDLDSYIMTPAIYQEYIDKEYELRVTVVGNEVFAARVDSQQYQDAEVDWRRKKIKFEGYALPDKIVEQCRQMVKKLNLSFGAFDFIKKQNGDYYFLEVNPNGQWVWIEKDTAHPISNAIINFLL